MPHTRRYIVDPALPHNQHFHVVLIEKGFWHMPGGGASEYGESRYHLVPVSREARVWLSAIAEKRCSADGAQCYPGLIQRSPGALQELGIRISDGIFVLRHFNATTKQCVAQEKGSGLESALNRLTVGLERAMRKNISLFATM